ncbi:MAG TPA: IMS domain-containing protein, partial [Stenomitos sp.]
RQDIAIEQGMCWLLLGQPEAAHKSVLLTQDQESLEFLRQYSEGAPDLIPGLYLYTENWLQHEVYPYFRDLAGKPVSLQSYFDDPAIQKALSELEFKTAASTTTHIKKVPAIATDDPSWQADPANTSTPASAPVNPSTTAAPASQPFVADDPLDGIFDSAAVLEPTVQRSTAKASDPRSVAPLAGSAEAAGSSRPQRARAKASTAGTPPTQELRKKVKQRSGRQPNSKPAKSMGWIPWAIGLLIMTGFVVGAMALSRWMKPTETASPDLPLGTASPSFSPSPTPSLPSPTAASQSPTATPTTTATPSASGSPSGTASSTPSALPTRSPAASSTSSVLSKADAAQVIENWQSIKATSRGQQYDTSKLSQVLADPVLSDWKRQVSDDKSNRVYLEYNLDSVDIQAVKPNGANQASVQALVKETRKTYDNGKVDTANSKADSYRVEYRLARQNDQWLIKDWVVLP